MSPWGSERGRGRALADLPVVRTLVRAYEDRLTPRGRYLLWCLFAFALLGLDTRRTQVYLMFAAAAGLFTSAAAFAFLPRPRARVSGRVPDRATAGRSLAVRFTVDADGALPDLHLSLGPDRRRSPHLVVDPPHVALSAAAGRPVEAAFQLRPLRRGRYELKGARLRSTDPLGFITTLPVGAPDQAVVVYPRYYRMDEFKIPLGRRYQPGGIPLASSTGDAIEFVGTREYREGDPIKNIHWRSWARRGEPVVKEYQEEYFCRIALILDTFLPARPAAPHLEGFEAAISVLASICDHFSRSEYVVDILAAGPDVYHVSAGRSLAYFDNVLDVLACLEPCPDPPFAGIGPALFDKLSQITTVVAVLQDWDEARFGFLRRLKEMGTGLRVLVVHEGATATEWRAAADELGEITQMTPADVRAALTRDGA